VFSFMNSSVRNQLRLAFTLVIALSLLSSGLAIWRLNATQQNATLVEEAAATAVALQEQAAHLAAMMARFRTGEPDARAPQRHAARQPARPALRAA